MGIRIRTRSYDLHLFGPHPAVSVRFEYNSQDRLTLDPSLTLEKQRIINGLVKAGKSIRILPLYRFRSITENPEGIVLDLGHTDFGEYLLTDVSHPEWNASDEYPMSNPLSVSAVTESSDHFLLLGYRSAAVVTHAGKIQTVPGGYIHPPDLIAESVGKELYEELAVTQSEIRDLRVTGLARIHPSGKPEILLHIRLNIPSSEIFFRSGPDRWEFSRLFTIPASRDSVADFIASSGSAVAPASHAALSAYAFHVSGTAPIRQV